MGRKKNKVQEPVVEFVPEEEDSITVSVTVTTNPVISTVGTAISTELTTTEIPWVCGQKCATHNKYNCPRCYRRK